MLGKLLKLFSQSPRNVIVEKEEVEDMGERGLLTVLSDYVFVKKDPRYFVDLVIRYLEDHSYPYYFVNEFKQHTPFVRFPVSYELHANKTYRVFCPEDLFYIVLGIETLAPARFDLSVDGFIEVISIEPKKTGFMISPPIILRENRTIGIYGVLLNAGVLDAEALADAVASKLETGVVSFKVILHGLFVSRNKYHPGIIMFKEVSELR
jgi:hypothetical protein